MAPIAAALTPLFSGIGSAVTGITGALGGAGAIGSTIGSILAGTATLMSVSASKGAAEIEATNLELQAKDQEAQRATETLAGIERRTSIKREMMTAIGEQSTAYAASGVDLSFGTPLQAREEAFRQADLGMETATGTERSRIARLEERASNLRSQATSTRRAAKAQGAAQILTGASRFLSRG
ncbi:hypothetical protein D3218_00365 [Aureimonas flava]|uniref:Uncharacterized protein n=1 Tax=Aureimonas flava TaxID=2320271 RepID=A0A3A1WQA7_9HYPH|nr:hypothetical protein [Aureimonas flava]RIY03264.1 hypothetical protein D3218_00365 [Aureimonas flava]